MTGEQIFVAIAFGLLVPLTAAYWYLDRRRSEHKKRHGAEQP